MNRSNNIDKLQAEIFDLCIIGGGASGAGCALDAALRGMRVLLVEKADFAAETSSKSTKLIHGGVRYLEQAFKKLDVAQLRQVRHGLEERYIVLQNAPHLTRPLGLITPVFSWLEGLYFSIGLKLYDWFASGKDTLPKSRWLSKKETLARMPGLSPGIHSAVLYYDGQLDDARYCLALVQSAAAAGAVVVNHVEVIDFQRDKQGKLATARVCDLLSDTVYTVQSRLFLNCTGPYADAVRQRANPALTPRIRPSKGVHVTLPNTILRSADAMLIPKTKDGRVVFAVPFENQLIVGTTDNDYPDLQKEPVLESSEVDFLLETLQRFLANTVDRVAVKAGFGGLRPLVIPAPQRILPKKGAKVTKSLLRDHEVEYDPASGLLSLLGGKWTTYRLMARDAVDAVCNLLQIKAVCKTADHPLTGAADYDFESWRMLQTEFGFAEDICQHLVLKYGTLARDVAALTRARPDLGTRLHPDFPFLPAEIVHAVRAEMACTPRDVLARRLRLEMCDWSATLQAIPQVVALMGEELGWNEMERTAQKATYTAQIQGFMRMING